MSLSSETTTNLSCASHLSCLHCGRQYPLTKMYYCPHCGDENRLTSLNFTLSVEYDCEKVARTWDPRRHSPKAAAPSGHAAGLWRFAPLLPVSDPQNMINIGAGNTPFVPLERFTRENPALSGIEVFGKVEGSNPTGSFKDRPLTTAVSKAKELGATEISCFTSGNVGSAAAALAAVGGLRAHVFLMPAGGLTAGEASVNQEKHVQIDAYGANVYTPTGTNEQIAEFALEANRRYSWYFINLFELGNPYLVEGDKTIAYEIAESLGWVAPDYCIVPVGTGDNLFGIWKGFQELHRLGVIPALPKMVGVQPQGADPLVEAIRTQAREVPVLPEVRNNVALPITHRVSGYHALRAIVESGGTATFVTDEEMLGAMRGLARSEGIFVEPASASSLAAVAKLAKEGVLGSVARVAVVFTSNGLKAVSQLAAERRSGGIPTFPADIEQLEVVMRH